ncbi:hypothetical protein BC834DRAFT_875745 [Gloeopeniophorella convolvens]|nr:hypothetical protein BC834DRAFT_875745 [Gloeopeniophorella convolvens]
MWSVIGGVGTVRNSSDEAGVMIPVHPSVHPPARPPPAPQRSTLLPPPRTWPMQWCRKRNEFTLAPADHHAHILTCPQALTCTGGFTAGKLYLAILVTAKCTRMIIYISPGTPWVNPLYLPLICACSQVFLMYLRDRTVQRDRDLDPSGALTLIGASTKRGLSACMIFCPNS